MEKIKKDCKKITVFEEMLPKMKEEIEKGNQKTLNDFKEERGRMKNKFILDACCGGRCFWFNKQHPNTIYQDKRISPKGHVKLRPNHNVTPDVVGDFRKMDFLDKSFKLVVWDPPHLTQGGETGWQVQKYGKLDKENWREDLTKGFNEIWRVLEDYGILIFKWNEFSITIKEVLKCFSERPLFGHPTAKSGKTKWVTFMKIPKGDE